MHPFRIISSYQPHFICLEIEKYIELTNYEISSMELKENSFNHYHYTSVINFYVKINSIVLLFFQV
jgi:hypothetical protein